VASFTMGRDIITEQRKGHDHGHNPLARRTYDI
jgi:hypothetical protein